MMGGGRSCSARGIIGWIRILLLEIINGTPAAARWEAGKSSHTYSFVVVSLWTRCPSSHVCWHKFIEVVNFDA